MKPIQEFAKSLSHALHRGQTRKDGKTLYQVHTDYVGDNLDKTIIKLGFSEDVLGSDYFYIGMAAAYLHDTIEDCCSRETLMSFGKDYPDWFKVVDLVEILTRDKSKPILDYLNRIKYNGMAKAIKLTDLEHNLSDLGPGNLRDKYNLCVYFLLN